jgi:hypothetical protein
VVFFFLSVAQKYLINGVVVVDNHEVIWSNRSTRVEFGASGLYGVISMGLISMGLISLKWLSSDHMVHSLKKCRLASACRKSQMIDSETWVWYGLM